jgi:ParB-like nuclease domain
VGKDAPFLLTGANVQIEMIALSKLVPYPGNPRLNDQAVEAVMRSLQAFGAQQPIVVDKNYVIIVGHTRHKAALKLGWTEFPVVVAHNMSEADAKAYRLADNKTASIAEWDPDRLPAELLALQGMNYDMSLLGWKPDELKELLALPAPAGEGGDEFDAAALEGPTRTQPGELWVLGGTHRLLVGDCTDAANTKRLMGDEKAFLMATDPPYGVDFSIAGHNPTAKNWGTIANDGVSELDLERLLGNVFKAWTPSMSEQASYYFWSAALEQGSLRFVQLRPLVSTFNLR